MRTLDARVMQARKLTDPCLSLPDAASTSKKRAAADDDEEDEDHDDDDEDDDDDDEEDDFKVPTSIKTGSRKRAPKGTNPPHGSSAAKRKKTTTTTSGTRKPAAATRGRKRAAVAGGGDDDDVDAGASKAAVSGSAKPGKDFQINDDNEIFSAFAPTFSLLSGAASLARASFRC